MKYEYFSDIIKNIDDLEVLNDIKMQLDDPDFYSGCGIYADKLRQIILALIPLIQERKGWIELANQCRDNANFYRSILYQCAEYLGQEVYISDDGSIQDTPIILKIPEIIKNLTNK